jgi:hypothetical protein
MRYYHPFEFSGDSFEARVGAPDPSSAAIGRIALGFAALEAHLTATLLRLREGDEPWHSLLTGGLSFAEKLHLLDERVRLLAPTRAFNTGDVDPVELFAELRTLCAQAARLRAQVLDPVTAEAMLTRIVRGQGRGSSGRDRPTQRSLTGTDMIVDPGALLDVSDFISMVIMELEEFFGLDGSPPPRVHGVWRCWDEPPTGPLPGVARASAWRRLAGARLTTGWTAPRRRGVPQRTRRCRKRLGSRFCWGWRAPGTDRCSRHRREQGGP